MLVIVYLRYTKNIMREWLEIGCFIKKFLKLSNAYKNVNENETKNNQRKVKSLKMIKKD